MPLISPHDVTIHKSAPFAVTVTVTGTSPPQLTISLVVLPLKMTSVM